MGANGPIGVFVHVATIGTYQSILDEVTGALFSSTLFPLVDRVCICVVGDGPVNMPALGDKLKVLRASPSVTVYERPTLEAMQVYARAEPTARVLYLNCLGGRYEGEDARNRAEWRRMLHFLLIERHDVALQALHSADCCGVEWSVRPLPHLTSNNWWARASHLAALPTPLAAQAKVLRLDLTRFGRHWARPELKQRHAGEFWLGMRDGVVAHSLFPLSHTGLPRSPYGLVPWWELRRVPWAALARRQFERGPAQPVRVDTATRWRAHGLQGLRRLLRLGGSTAAWVAAAVRRRRSS